MAISATQRKVLRYAPFLGFRPGSNLWADVAYTRPELKTEDDILFDGIEVEPLLRMGMLSVEPLSDVKVMDRLHPEGFEVEITHRYCRTPAGDAALAAN